MKRIYLAAIVMVLAGGAVFARGTMESEDNARFGEGAGPGSNRDAEIVGEVTTVSGTIMEEDGKVVLETADGSYTLSAGRMGRDPVEIPFGETVTVTGTTVACDGEDCPEDGCDLDSSGHIFVKSAESGSESYSFDGVRGPAGTAGGRNADGSRETGSRSLTGDARGARNELDNRGSGPDHDLPGEKRGGRGDQMPRGGRDARGDSGRGNGLMDGSGMEDAE